MSPASRPALRPVVSLIAALDRQRGIGRAGGLLWRESEDQKHFRTVTTGSPVLMGRKTWDSIPARFRPLPGRRNLVLTRDPRWQAEGAETVASLEAALALAQGSARLYVIGGAEVYRLALPQADELVLTEIDAQFADAETFFPSWSPAAFALVEHESRTAADGTRYAFATYRRHPEIQATR